MAEIRSELISNAWIEAVTCAHRSPHGEVSPLIVSMDNVGGKGIEDNVDVRREVASFLAGREKFAVETIASTIFPFYLWNHRKGRKVLFDRYERLLPRIRKFPQNKRGVYFERLISYPCEGGGAKNQLEHVIETYLNWTTRRSTLQAAILVPDKDLTHANIQGFPCLQQVSFQGDKRTNTLTVTGFYPLQYLVEKAYGNYLGLVRLGMFMAKEMKLTLGKVVCVASTGTLGVPKRDVLPLLKRLTSIANQELQ